MLRVTFYSYKGGVGRTLALLNVAAILAERGKRVVAVDLDLEAPGFGLSSFTGGRAGKERGGVSDLVLDWQDGGDAPVESCVRIVDPERFGDRLRIMPAGTRAGELIRRLPDFYADPQADAARIFELFVHKLAAAFAPDFMFFDSRTGHADIAGVSVLELAEVLVAFSGLNEQNVYGMKETLELFARHEARPAGLATIVVLSPVPAPEDLEPDELGLEAGGPVKEALMQGDPLLKAFYRARAVFGDILRQGRDEVRTCHPRLRDEDCLHWLIYDPLVPISGELQIMRPCKLVEQYHRLADAILRAGPGLG